MKRVLLNSNYAVAYAVRDVDVDVIAAYPITPQTGVVEKLSELIAGGELDAEMIHVESEHSALSAVVGAAAAGARVFTATSSQGLEFMHEVLPITAGMRLPVVMAVATRAVSAPLNIWCDYSDLMNVRDSSWITTIASTAQEVYDSVIEAYMVAEDPRVLLPAIVAYDGFWMSHTYEPLFVPEDPREVRELVPRRQRERLDPDSPITLGTLVGPDWYYELKYQQVEAMKMAKEVMAEARGKMQKVLGRSYEPIESYEAEGADLLVLTYGGIFGNVMEAARRYREKGARVGALRLRLWRPFPGEELRRATEGASKVIVIDRAVSYGTPISGPVALEVMASLYGSGIDVVSFVAGLGGRAVTERDVMGMIERGSKVKGMRETLYWGVRGVEA
ncbi:MAG: ferredoxin oxidoreductase [Acidilobaceae archaeon]|nr:ferredoxin oxidoreductase [Acidilobaceae archaeon]MCX8166169.1 ferredoxin oxidoreductase [Acidilobaceae archaeon]MDW7974807.1 pyruvate ferredoxin oxidoreductase [Sulfolobales archaeon]